MATIDSFRSALTGGGARPSQFQVALTFPNGMQNVAAINAGVFLIKAATLPASSIQSIEVPFRGRMAKIAGERVFGNWQVQILNDTDFLVRKSLEYWSSQILNHGNTTGIVNPSDYTATLTVTQLGRDDVPLRVYQMFNCFPTHIGEIGLDFANAASIQEYPVEFSVDYWLPISDGTIK